MDFPFTEEQELLRANVGKPMDRHSLSDYVARSDRDTAYPYERYDAGVEAGLFLSQRSMAASAAR
jgi:hypothetical protein